MKSSSRPIAAAGRFRISTPILQGWTGCVFPFDWAWRKGRFGRPPTASLKIPIFAAMSSFCGIQIEATPDRAAEMPSPDEVGRRESRRLLNHQPKVPDHRLPHDELLRLAGHGHREIVDEADVFRRLV